MPQRKILILTASPDDKAKLRTNQEIVAINDELKGSKCQDIFKIIFELEVKPDKLDSILQTEQPEIVHFCGHGQEEGIVLQDDAEKAQVVPLESLADLISMFKNTKCVVLNACYAETQANKLNEYVQYVIGMKEKIKDNAAIVFAKHFYRALFAGYNYKDAYKFGKIAVGILRMENSFLPVFLEKSQPILPKRQNPPTHIHYNNVINAFKNGQVIPFLGPDVNFYGSEEDLPIEVELAQYLAEDMDISYVWNVEDWIGMGIYDYDPGKMSISEAWKRGISKKESIRLILQKMAEYLFLVYGYQAFYRKINEYYQSRRYKPNFIYQFFANLPREMRDKGYPLPYQLLVTTNYDDMLEQAFKVVKQPFDLVLYIAEGEDKKGRFLFKPYEESFCPINSDQEMLSSDRPVIVKLYGTVNNFVITEDHHINYLVYRDIDQLLPKDLLNILWKSHNIFMGYSPNDANLRLIINRLWGDEAMGQKSWMIHQSKPGELDKEFWKKRNVELLDRDLEEYVDKLDHKIKILERER